MPPIVASAPGSTGNIRPVFFRWSFSFRCVSPASTVTSMSSGERCTTRVIRVRSIVTPPLDRVDVSFERAAHAEGNRPARVPAHTPPRWLRLRRGLGKGHGIWRRGLVPRLAVSCDDRARTARSRAGRPEAPRRSSRMVKVPLVPRCSSACGAPVAVKVSILTSVQQRRARGQSPAPFVSFVTFVSFVPPRLEGEAEPDLSDPLFRVLEVARELVRLHESRALSVGHERRRVLAR